MIIIILSFYTVVRIPLFETNAYIIQSPNNNDQKKKRDLRTNTHTMKPKSFLVVLLSQRNEYV